MSEGTEGLGGLYKLCTTLYAKTEELTLYESSKELNNFVLSGLMLLTIIMGFLTFKFWTSFL